MYEELDEIEGDFERETEKAYGLKVNGELHWFPKSQCTIHRLPREDNGRQRAKIEAPLWLIEKKGL